METLYRVGYSGVGKTMIGRLIASRKELIFLDTNKSIVEKENKSINDIVKENGEEYFLNLEKSILKNSIVHGMIVSIGAIVPKDEENRRLIKTSGKVIYLRAKPQTIYDNIKDSYDKRPYLANNFSVFTVEKKLQEMIPHYEELANYIIDVDNKHIDAIFKEALAIYNYINKIKYHIYIK